MWQRWHHTTFQPQHKEARQESPVRNENSGLVMKTFKDHIRSESVLVPLSGVRACRVIDPLSNFLVSARSQTSHWFIFLIYAVE